MSGQTHHWSDCADHTVNSRGQYCTTPEIPLLLNKCDSCCFFGLVVTDQTCSSLSLHWELCIDNVSL